MNTSMFQQCFRDGKSYEVICDFSACGFSTSNFSPLLSCHRANYYKGLKPLVESGE